LIIFQSDRWTINYHPSAANSITLKANLLTADSNDTAGLLVIKAQLLEIRFAANRLDYVFPATATCIIAEFEQNCCY
jgi:hypothetical protein